MIVTRTAYVMDTTVYLSGNGGRLVDILFDQADGLSPKSFTLACGVGG